MKIQEKYRLQEETADPLYEIQVKFSNMTERETVNCMYELRAMYPLLDVVLRTPRWDGVPP